MSGINDCVQRMWAHIHVQTESDWDMIDGELHAALAIARTEGIEEAITRIKMSSDDGISQFGGVVMRGKTVGDNAVYIVPASVLDVKGVK